MMDYSLEDFFEYYTMEELDAPKLSMEITELLGPLFTNEVLSLKIMEKLLTKDAKMTKPRKDHKESRQMEILAKLFLAIREFSMEGRDEIVARLVLTSGFDFKKFVPENQFELFAKCAVSFSFIFLFSFCFLHDPRRK